MLADLGARGFQHAQAVMSEICKTCLFNRVQWFVIYAGANGTVGNTYLMRKGKEKDFHFNNENMNSHPEYNGSYNDSTALLSDLRS